MLKITCFCLALMAASPLWSQVEPSATGGGFDLDDSHMMTPPPVSGDAYPVIVGTETRSNFLAGGLVFTAASADNLIVPGNTRAVTDETYSIIPTISFDRRTPRQGESLNYSSGFTLYQKTSQLNGVSQDADAGYRFHVSPYAVIVVREAFRQNYNLYNQPNPFAGSGVSGTPGSPNTVLIAPFENQIGNSTNAGIEYQYGRNAMIGGSGSYSVLRYTNLSDVPGLNDANTTSTSGYYSRRLTRSQYVGTVYEFSKIITHPIDTYTITHTVFGVYTIYFTRSFSFSILGGPEHYTSWTSTVPKQRSWTPAVEGSFGWQTPRANIAATYSHIVSGAGGLIGAYHANFVSISARLSLARTWTVGAGTDYSLFKNASPVDVQFSSGGHTLAGTAFLEHRIAPNVNAQAGYAHFHQSYANIPIASSFPDSNREYISITYQFAKPLGQ